MNRPTTTEPAMLPYTLVASVSIALIFAGFLASVIMPTSEVPLWIPVVAWPPAYAGVSYWVGREAKSSEGGKAKHGDGVRLIPHGFAFGVLVALFTIALRLINPDSLPARLLRVCAVAAGFALLWLYARRAAKWTKGEATGAALFGGLPMLAAGGLLDDYRDD